MKLALVSLLLPFIVASASLSASSYEAECFDGEFVEDNEYVNLPNLPEVEVWDYVNTETSAPELENLEIEASPLNWSIRSFFGSFFSSISPFKQATPPPPPPLIGPGGAADLEVMSNVINCSKERLRMYDVSIRERVVALKNIITRTKILSHLADIGVKSLFELFVDSNISIILTEITSIHNFNSVAFGCIKIDSINSLLNIMLNIKYRLNAPHAVIVASINGSHEVLQYVLEQQNNSDYAWEWKSFDGGDGFMLDFGIDPFSAALFLGSLKAISCGQLDCLKILVSNGVNVNFKDYMLLKESTSVQGSETFKLLYNAANNISNLLMNEILLLAIEKNNDSLVEYLLTLDYTYKVNVHNHLVSTINCNNTKLFNMILPRIDSITLNGQILSLAATSGNVEIFIELLKVSSKSLIIAAICNSITNESLNHFVPHIISNIPVDSEIVAQALLHSAKVRSLPFVQLFLGHEACDQQSVETPFIEALFANDAYIVNEFFKKFSPDNLIHPNLISKTVTKLFEVKAWNSMKIIVENYFESSNFPKRNFISMLIITDQVEIAILASAKGAKFLQSELVKVRNDEMRNFVIQTIGKSQIKSRDR